MKQLSNFLLILFMSFAFIACSNDDKNNEPDLTGNEIYDIVTFVGNPQSNNNNSVFQFQKENDSRLTTLRATNIALDSTTIKVNTRLLLAYNPESGMHNVDDNITVKGYSIVFNDSIRTGDITKLPNWDFNPIFVNSILRSGTYLNIHCGLTYSYEPSGFILLIDAETINNPMPDVYLSYQKGDDRESYNKEFYASIDISNLWNRPSCKGFTLHVNDSNFGNNTIEFKKITLTPMQ